MNHIVFLAFFSFLSPTVSFAVEVDFGGGEENNSESKSTATVVVTGYGMDPDSALKNAIRTAVEQVVGAYVKSNTLVEKGELVEDTILSHSSGYVKEVNVITQRKDEAGLFLVKIEARVIVALLKQKLEEVNIAIREVEGDSLYAEAVSKAELKQTAEEMLESVFAKYPQAAFKITLGKPKIGEDKGDSVELKIPMQVTWDQDFLSELKTTLEQVAFKNHERYLYKNGIPIMDDSYRDISSDIYLYCFGKTRSLTKSMLASSCSSVSADMGKIYENLKIDHPRYYGFVTPVFELMAILNDATGELLDSSPITWLAGSNINRHFDLLTFRSSYPFGSSGGVQGFRLRNKANYLASSAAAKLNNDGKSIVIRASNFAVDGLIEFTGVVIVDKAVLTETKSIEVAIVK